MNLFIDSLMNAYDIFWPHSPPPHCLFTMNILLPTSPIIVQSFSFLSVSRPHYIQPTIAGIAKYFEIKCYAYSLEWGTEKDDLIISISFKRDVK